MKRFLFTIVSMLFAGSLLAQSENSIVGTWLTQDKDSKVEISKGKDGKFRGAIVWLKEPNRNGMPKKDDKNPDAKLRTRPILGLPLLMGFNFDKDNNEWIDGAIYDPKSGKSYKCLLWFEKDLNTLHVKGFIGFSLIGKEIKWTKTTK